MRPDEFIAAVQREAELTEEEAREAVVATLAVLADRLGRGLPERVFDLLPDTIEAPLRRGHKHGEPLSIVQFYRQIARQRDVPESQARQDAQGIMAVLEGSLDDQVLREIAEQLPAEYAELFSKEFVTPELPEPDPAP
jgi:uncharacterized protein (DUF2267 family)